MSKRFYCDSPIEGAHAELTGDEAHHLTRVMRASSGDHIVVFDGSGFEYTAVIGETGRHHVTLTIVERRFIERESPRKLTLAVSLPKGDRQRMLIEKCVELGVSRVIPLRTARGVATAKEKSLVRLQRSIIEASKQCGRNQLMQLDSEVALADLPQHLQEEAAVFVGHPTGTHSFGSRLQALPHSTPVVMLIGPEGGFAPEELARADEYHWQLVTLAPAVLRIETAALAAAAVCNCY